VRKLLLVIAMACTTGTAADRNVIGRWRSLETSKSGIGGMFIFREDGTLEFSPGAVVETEYRVEGSCYIPDPHSCLLVTAHIDTMTNTNSTTETTRAHAF
jgi:hypothetical protein